MMDKEIFRRTERKLYNYFRKDKKINSIKKKIELLNIQIGDIEKKLKEVNINIPEESRSITYEERVQSSGDCTSYAEKTLMRITDNLLNEKVRKLEEISELEENIRTIQANNIIIENNIKDIREEDREFLKTKYDKELPDWEVGLNLSMSQSNVSRRRQRLVENVANWEVWQKNLH